MSTPTRILGAAAALLTLSAPVGAQERCRQADIAGTWDTYFAGGEIGEGVWVGWTACRITVSRKGRPTGPCVETDGALTQIVRGQLRVHDNCRVSGRMVVEFAPESEVALEIPRATLSPSREAVVGVARATLDDLLFSFLLQMVRR